MSIKVPEYLTEDLAYFLGFHVGDGYMKVKIRKYKHDYHLYYGGHHINERQWYEDFVKPLIKRLFNKDVTTTMAKSGIVKIDFRSKAIVTFLHNCCGLPFSPKLNTGVLPIIKESSTRIKCSFLRGLADTDFSLVFKRTGKYPVIKHMTYSKKLHTDLVNLIKGLGFSIYFASYTRELNGRKNNSHQIGVSGRENLVRWLSLVGFSSYNTITRYLVWKETGSLPKGTDINDRIKILKERGIASPLKAPRVGFEPTTARLTASRTKTIS